MALAVCSYCKKQADVEFVCVDCERIVCSVHAVYTVEDKFRIRCFRCGEKFERQRLQAKRKFAQIGGDAK